MFSTFIKEKSPAFFAVSAIFSGSLMYLPEKTIAHLGLNQFIEENTVWIGAAFLFSIAYLVVSAVVFLGKYLKKSLAVRSRKKFSKLEQKRYMANLTFEEVLYLVPFLIGRNSLYLKQEDGVRGGLEAKEILYRSATVGSMVSGFAYNIQPWALDYMKENPDTYVRHVGVLDSEDAVKALYNDGYPWEAIGW